MDGWQLVREILGGANFYWRKFFVFLLVVGLATTGYWGLKNQAKIQASQNSSTTSSSEKSDDVNYKVEIKSNGQVFANNKDISKTFKILPDGYEVRILAVDSPEEYIGRFYGEIILPQDVNESQVELTMYAVHGVGSYRAYMKDSRTLVYEAEDIDSEASVTMVAKMPKSIIMPSFDKVFLYNLAQFSAKAYLIFVFGLPLLTLIILVFMVTKKRRDQFIAMGDKISMQPPEDISPAVIGALVDAQLGSREIAAILIDLAARGYIFINKKGDSFSFGKRKSLNLEQMPELKTFERVLLTKIFEPQSYKSTRTDVEMRVGRHIFSRKIAKVYLEIYNEATRLGYFVKNPALVHLKWKYAGIGLFFSSFLGFILNAVYAPDPKFILFFWVGGMISASIIVNLSKLMPVRSETGSLAMRRWMEFQRYLKMNRPIEPKASLTEVFTRYLPFAIVFGVEVEWAKRFMVEPFIKPDWYESDDSVVALETFIGGLFPIINYVGTTLDKSKEPTVI